MDLRAPRSERSLGAVLRAVGALLLALGGEHDESPVARARPIESSLRAVGAAMPPSSAVPPAQMRAERPMNQPPREAWGAEAPVGEVSALLADARARALALIDEAVGRADTLLREQAAPQRQTPSLDAGQPIEQLRRLMSDIATEVRAVHLRLDSIETFLRTMPAPGVLTGMPMYGSQPVYGAPPGYMPVPQPPAAPSSSGPAPQPAAAPAPTVAPPSSAMPPQARPLPASPRGVENSTPPGAWSPGFAAAAPPRPPDATGFDLDGGSVALRISPVAGFQGLMRVQDALVRVRGIREAGVEAYAQGEARLRLQLAEHMEPEQLASSLGELLGRPARVTSTSLAERMVQVALE